MVRAAVLIPAARSGAARQQGAARADYLPTAWNAYINANSHYTPDVSDYYFIQWWELSHATLA